MANSQRSDDRLLDCHRLHLGLYARVAEELDLAPSYISLVAAGKRQSERVTRAIVAELKRIDRIRNGS